MLRSPVSQSMSQAPNGFPTSVLLGLSQANQNLQQPSTYSNPYAFSTSNFKAIQQQQSSTQQISINQQPNDVSISQQQLYLQLSQQQRQQQNPFQAQNNRQIPQLPNTAQSFNNQRQTSDLSNYLAQNGGNGVSTPSASLASILTAGPRANNNIQTSTNPQIQESIKRELLVQPNPKQSNMKLSNNNHQSWNNTTNKTSTIQTIAGPPSISETLNARSNLMEENKLYSKSSMKAPKQPILTSTSNPTPASNGYKRRNSRQNPSIDELSPSEPISNGRRSSARNKRTRSQMLPDTPIASTSNLSVKQHPLSQPASVQTQFSYGNDTEMLSPMNTPQTDGIVSDESFEERSPSGL